MAVRLPILDTGKLHARLDELLASGPGDFVLCPKLHNHHLEPTRSETTVRIGINTRGEFHRYDRPGCRSDLWRSETSGATG